MTTSPRPTRARTNPRRKLDLVVFGATGFTGRLVAEYLARKAPPGVRIALAGRNLERLTAVRNGMGGRTHDWPLIVADTTKPDDIVDMAAATRAVVTTVGPYAKYGLPLVAACAEAGTHYADLAGEVLFMRESIDRFDHVAKSSGSRIVHTCGFDSIPSDLGVLALHLAAKADDGNGLIDRTEMVVVRLSGGISGGTLASGFNEMDEAEGDDRARRILRDPYGLSPDRVAEPRGDDKVEFRGVDTDDVLGVWVGPFMMAAINTRVVRRSNALLGYAYGKDFRYREAMSTGHGLAGRLGAVALAGGSFAGSSLLRFRLGRKLAETVLPEPGEGPDERTREKGRFSIVLHTRTPANVPYRALVAAQGDPGYAATALMLGQSGLTLAGDQRRLPRRAGVLTPATAMGRTLIENLKTAGMTITAGKV